MNEKIKSLIAQLKWFDSVREAADVSLHNAGAGHPGARHFVDTINYFEGKIEALIAELEHERTTL